MQLAMFLREHSFFFSVTDLLEEFAYLVNRGQPMELLPSNVPEQLRTKEEIYKKFEQQIVRSSEIEMSVTNCLLKFISQEIKNPLK
jgi:hypothetical protein